MKDTIFLENEEGKRLYQLVRELPIVDYHCHLSPEQIARDEVFSNIGELWLAGDHYKWRLMRSLGVEERLITGDASYFEKFKAYAACIAISPGNPLYHWTVMELFMYFNIDIPLNEQSAKTIWDEANRVIEREQLSPRRMLEKAKVIYVATTDDPADSLDFHHMLKEDKGFNTVVAPTFRTDKAVSIRADGYGEYIKALSASSGVLIRNLKSFKEAIRARLNDFCAMGCRFSDVGIEDFPKGFCDEEKAEKIFGDALLGNEISDEDYRGFLGYIYCFLGGEYEERGITMQLHLAVKRNASTTLLKSISADCGGDCINDPVSVNALIALLDKMELEGARPKTIIYTLNPASVEAFSTVAGSFRGVLSGAAWWFCDHKGGIEHQLTAVAQTSSIATFPGMLTDSRSFLSYSRHDYFRRIFCNMIGKMLESGEMTDEASAIELVRRVCIKNSMELAGL